jgi:hypothetical protein
LAIIIFVVKVFLVLTLKFFSMFKSRNGFGINVVPGFRLKRPFVDSPVRRLNIKKEIPKKIGETTDKVVNR